MDIYSQFRKDKFFKKFKALLKDWQNIDILLVIRRKDKIFYDSPSKLSPGPVSELLKSIFFRNHFLRSINKLFKEPSSKTLKPWRQTGLRLLTVPLWQKPSPLSACLVCVTLSPRKEEQLQEALIYSGLSKPEARKMATQVKPLSTQDEELLQTMIKLLGEDLFKLFQTTGQRAEAEKGTGTGTGTGTGRLLPHQLSEKFIVGDSPSMRYIQRFLKKIKGQDTNVLIEGEEGVGKKLLAKSIHSQSLRSNKPFCVRSFYTLEESALELELFAPIMKKQGIRQGIRQGIKQANRQKGGRQSHTVKSSLLEEIDGGSLILHGIEKSSEGFQRRWLKFLKTGVYLCGGTRKKVSVRHFALTCQNLKELVKKRKFNKNLYAVLSQAKIKIPPLRRRKDDIVQLSDWFLKQKSPIRKKLAPETLKILCSYHWPENVRELEQEISKLLSLSTEGQSLITEQNISSQIRGGSFFLAQLFQRGQKQKLKDVLRSVEKQVLLTCLQQTHWNKSRVAKLIGISRTTVVAKVSEYGFEKKK